MGADVPVLRSLSCVMRLVKNLPSVRQPTSANLRWPDAQGESVSRHRQFGTVPLSDLIGKARQIWFSKGEEGIRWSRFGKVVE